MWEQFTEDVVVNSRLVGGKIGAWLGTHGLRIVVILVIMYALQKFGKALLMSVIVQTVRRDMFPTELDRKKRLETLESLTGAALRIGLWLVTAILVIDELGVDTAPLLASAGVLGVALGFGAQSLIKDFVSGIFIITENQYRVGDIVELSNVAGTVQAITIRTTVLRDLNGDVHHIPNGTITVTTNKTMDYGGLNEEITLGYKTDLEELEKLIDKVGKDMSKDADFENIIRKPPYFAQVVGFGPQGVTVRILAKVKPSEQWRVKSELYRRLMLVFAEHNIQPYNQPIEQPRHKITKTVSKK